MIGVHFQYNASSIVTLLSMLRVAMEETESVEDRFNRLLFQKYAKNEKHLMPKSKYFQILEEMMENGSRKTPRQYKLLSK